MATSWSGRMGSARWSRWRRTCWLGASYIRSDFECYSMLLLLRRVFAYRRHQMRSGDSYLRVRPGLPKGGLLSQITGCDPKVSRCVSRSGVYHPRKEWCSDWTETEVKSRGLKAVLTINTWSKDFNSISCGRLSHREGAWRVFSAQWTKPQRRLCKAGKYNQDYDQSVVL
jgi:hypothetical protein